MEHPSNTALDPADLADLRRQLADPDPVLRGRAAAALGEAGDATAIPGIKALLQDRDRVLSFKAACALAWLHDDSGVRVLLWALSNQELCFAALQALTELGSPAALPELTKFFDRFFLHALEKLQAAAALHRCGDERGLAFIAGRLRSLRPEERGFALELWGRLRSPGALDRLLQVANSQEDPQRLDAVRGLMQLGDPRALPTLDRLSRDPADPELAELAQEAAASLRAGPT